jgi:cytochrome c553
MSMGWSAPIIARVTAICVAGTSLFLASNPTYAGPAATVRTAAVMCGTCHGTRGEGTPAGVPRLAGQNADYMAHALSLFKAGTRKSAIMQPIAAGLSDTQRHALAVYFSQQKAQIPDSRSAWSPVLVPAGKQLAETGATNVAPCFSCHGAKAQGTGPHFPGIAGQPAQFVIDRIHEFQARARNAVPQAGTMTAVAAMMSEDQVQAAAAYLSRSGGG